MLSPGHLHPSSSTLTEFSAFFKAGRVLNNGNGEIILSLGSESINAIIDMGKGDGLALNVTVERTGLPEELGSLAAALGLDIADPQSSAGPQSSFDPLLLESEDE